MRLPAAILLASIALPAYAAEPLDPMRFQGGGVTQKTHYAKHKRIREARKASIFKRYASRPGSRDLTGFPQPLINKTRELEQNCNAHVISGYRPGARVAGSGRRSLHADKKAADMTGNYACMYAHLKGWPGGYSTDSYRVSHIHISYDVHGREWGARFAHYHGGTRYAHRRNRYAMR